MKPELLTILRCPLCNADLRVEPTEQDGVEIRSGYLYCAGNGGHCFEISKGILQLATGFDHHLVKKELAYENSTYCGSPRLCDPDLIARFPDTLPELWPHTSHFGDDFKDLIRTISVRPEHWVLDIGTGPCWSSRLLAEQGARVIALDINDSPYYGLGTAELLFAHHGVYFERILESMTHLPFASESIDRITFNASFHHTPDLCQTLQECYRVLKQNGVTAMVNEEFGSLRQSLFRHTELDDGGSHHRIPHKVFGKEALKVGFHIQYLMASHVRKQFTSNLPTPLAKAVIKFFEAVPFALYQLNSALILLTKAECRSSNRHQQTIPLFQHA